MTYKKYWDREFTQHNCNVLLYHSIIISKACMFSIPLTNTQAILENAKLNMSNLVKIYS